MGQMCRPWFDDPDCAVDGRAPVGLCDGLLMILGSLSTSRQGNVLHLRHHADCLAMVVLVALSLFLSRHLCREVTM